ncbi:iron complex outermembrane receptor protein [Novosphingobium hassiacum]|uniref:Iron complex outermembrane receptor protein n=1 Tax=Novosphingobium hassiacum TaxID=173676 RepID=A0A7W5ZXD0_9SPHN|nr:TonB-dependent receptor [Novosphingobium hassiacum]MBB3861715.1 iron complex outermembrane receptor protein [Novosphingobium hassiacum]
MAIANRTTSFVRLFAAASTAALALGTAMPAFAQEAQNQAQAEETATNREIVVTAQFREQRLQDTPLSITAVDATLLASRNQTDIAQIAQQAPNVTLNAMGGAFGSSLGASIRGVGQFDFNPAYEPGVGLYVDDVYYATLTGGIFDLLDLERVEVLRGPQGTLTGRNAIGGAIKLFSKKPTNENSGMVEAVYGSRNRVDIRGSANFVLAQDLSARVSGVYKRQNGYVDQIDYGCAKPGNPQGITGRAGSGSDCVIDKLGEKGYAGLRGSLRYNPGDNFDVVIIGDYTHEERTNSAEVISLINPARITNAYACGRFCTYANFYAPAGGQVSQAYEMPNRLKFDGYGFSANMTVGLNDSLNVQSITAYRNYRQRWGTDDDFTPDLAIAGQGYNDLKFWFFSQELRVNGQIGDNIDFTVGGFYSDQRSVYFTRQDIRYIAPGLNFQFLGNDPVNADSKALFGTLIARPIEGLTLTGGLRYTKESKDYTFVRKNYNGTVSTFLGALDGVKAVYSGDKVDWRVSADYRFSPEVLAYVTVSTGFKGGGVTARPFDAAQALNGSFDPETVTAYEAGLKTDLFDRRLRLNFAGFINDYNDIQLPLISCASLGSLAPCGARQNAGNGKIKGFEVEMQASPIDGLDIDASLSHLTGNYKNIDPRVGNAILLSDPIVTPNWKWSAGIQYRADLGTAGSITPRFDYAHVGRQSAGRLAAGQPIEYFNAYDLGNARLTWRNAEEDLSISLEVQNVFDEYYTPARFVSVYSFTGTGYSQVGRPREWAVTVQKRF